MRTPRCRTWSSCREQKTPYAPGRPKSGKEPTECRTTPLLPKSRPPTRQWKRRRARLTIRPRRPPTRPWPLRRPRRLLPRHPPRPPRFRTRQRISPRIRMRHPRSPLTSPAESETHPRQAADQLATRSRIRRAAGPRAVARAGRRVLSVGVRVERLRCVAACRIGARSFPGTRVDERGQGQHDQDAVVQAGHCRTAAQQRPRPAHR